MAHLRNSRTTVSKTEPINGRLEDCTLTQIRGLIRDRLVSVREAVETSLRVLEERNGSLHAVISVVESALNRADALDQWTERERPLFGIPFTVKDIMTVKGIRCTCGSAARVQSPLSQRTADAVAAAEAAGAVLIATANLHEWAGGPNSKNVTFGNVVNPVDESLTPGGSSGGSGAAVSSGIGYFSLGTDTGGSSRIPAACQGIAAWKPTPGLISTNGVYPVSPTLDTVGPMTRKAADLAWIMDAYIGPAPVQPTGPLRLGIEESYFFDLAHTSPSMADPVRDLLSRAEAYGAEIIPVKIPALRWAMAAEKVIMLGEWSQTHSRSRRADRPLYGDDIQQFLRIGDAVTAEFYLDAMKVRRLVTEQLVKTLSSLDALVSPTFPCSVPGRDQTEIEWSPGVSESVMDATWRFTLPANVAGLPAVVFSPDAPTADRSVPASVQLLGAPGRDRRLQFVAAYLAAL